MSDLTTISVVRQAIPRLASVADAEISRLISEASDVVSSYLNRDYGGSPYTETYDSTGGPLYLRNRPITAITSISTEAPDFATVVDPTMYRFDPITGEVRYGGSGSYFWGPWDAWPLFWPTCGWQSVRVVYTASAAVPKAVEGRCLAILNRLASTLALQTTLKAKSLGNVSFTYGDPTQFMALTDDDRAILSPYRIWML